jgi:uncharacterized protein YdbL (DUF1318 family)
MKEPEKPTEDPMKTAAYPHRHHRHLVWLASLAPLALAASCIVVNISFPAGEVQEAAEEIVKEVRPEDAPPAPAGTPVEGKTPETPGVPAPVEGKTPETPGAPPPAAPPTDGTTGEKQTSAWNSLWLASAWAEPARPLAAQDKKEEPKKPRIDITTPKIQKIKETLKKRYAQLLPFYTKGAIGEARSGYLALRDTAGLDLKEKRDADALLKAENDDRKNLYVEIAAANTIKPEDVDRIAGIFSEEWQKNARPGTWIEPEKDRWVKKPKAE